MSALKWCILTILLANVSTQKSSLNFAKFDFAKILPKDISHQMFNADSTQRASLLNHYVDLFVEEFNQFLRSNDHDQLRFAKDRTVIHGLDSVKRIRDVVVANDRSNLNLKVPLGFDRLKVDSGGGSPETFFSNDFTWDAKFSVGPRGPVKVTDIQLPDSKRQAGGEPRTVATILLQRALRKFVTTTIKSIVSAFNDRRK